MGVTLPRVCIVVHDKACLETGVSENKMIRGTTVLLESIYEDVRANPDEVPGEAFDLWVVFPPHEETWEEPYLESAFRRKAISVEQTPRIPDFDIYMNTEHHRYGTDVVDQIPFIPWVPPQPTSLDLPRDYVFWNGAHNHMLTSLDLIEIVSVLKDLGIRKVVMSKVWRAGEYKPIHDDPWFEVQNLAKNLPDEQYNRLLAEAFCLVHTGTTINSFQQDMALSYGIPIYGHRDARTNWSAHFTTLHGLRRYVGNEALYQARRINYDRIFGFPAARDRLLAAAM